MRNWPVVFSLVWVAFLIAIVSFAFDPRWETNDDVVMSMIAHGYGLAAYGSPNLVFSNVLWGYLVRAIPAINDVLGYSIATLATLLVIGWAMMYFLLRLGAGYLASLLAVILILARPTLFPQFTINAGLLTVVAVMGWQVYARLGGGGNLMLACLLAFFGYLIRGNEFLLVLVVALPMLPWRALKERRQMQSAILLLIMAIVAAEAFDYWSYSGAEWQHFLEFNSVRIPFTDYSAGDIIKQNQYIMQRYGYSQNDINLVRDWFFVDTQIADPKSLNEMLAELGSIPMPGRSVQSGLDALKALANPILLPLLLPAFVLLLLRPRKSVALAWAICLIAFFLIGIMGRPGILRIYVPLLSLLFIFPIAVNKYKEGFRQWIVILTIFVACVGNAYVLVPQAQESMQWTDQVRKDIHYFPVGPTVAWGYSFPYEQAFPVLANDLGARKIALYGLDAFTYAPFSVAAVEHKSGRGVIRRLQSAEGVPVIAYDNFVNELRIYCWERLRGRLRGGILGDAPWYEAQQLRCEAVE